MQKELKAFGSESECTNPNGTSLDASNSNEEALKGFLEKVANGTVTDFDLQNIHLVMRRMRADFSSTYKQLSTTRFD